MIKPVADWVIFRLLHLAPASKLGEALDFFLYDVVKILLMLSLIIFLVSLLRSFFPIDKTKKLLAGHREFVGNVGAALLGIVTPFCSCSAVPMFIGFVEAGIPLGVTFSFLISSPMVNEVALVMLWALFGWQIAAIYLAAGVSVAIVGGLAIGRLRLESQVEEYVYQLSMGEAQLRAMTWEDRFRYAYDYVKDILRRVTPYVIGGIAAGAIIHGYAPANFLARYAGPSNPLAVPVAVAIGVPLYSNAAGTIPIVQSLMEKGMGLGTVLAFMMSVTALSLPEMVILRRVVKPRLIGIFVGILAVAITGVGYLFNAILQ